MKQIISVGSVLMAMFAITTHVSASSNIHKTVDNKGRVTYANAQGKNYAKATHTSLSSGRIYPKIDSHQQKKRDFDRRQILESELAIETELLVGIINSLRLISIKMKEIQSESSQSTSAAINDFENDNINSLLNLASVHERNIIALRKELNSL